jgi:nucleoid-associated protein YgaU
MDKQPFIDRMLETENLTDNLEDDAANALIKWGIGQLDTLLEGITAEEAAGEKVSLLMKVMRGVNRIVGNQPTPAPERVAELAALYAQAFGRAPAAETADANAIAAEAAGMAGREAVTFLLDWAQKK